VLTTADNFRTRQPENWTLPRRIESQPGKFLRSYSRIDCNRANANAVCTSSSGIEDRLAQTRCLLFTLMTALLITPARPSGDNGCLVIVLFSQ